MLAEHGSLELLDYWFCLSPLILFLEYKFNLFLLCFLAFWFLTINHAAMRTAIPLCVFFVFVERAISWKKK
jgi:hypothetical protein